MIKKEYTCIVCPNSCSLEVTDNHGTMTVKGAGCKLGIIHGEKEYSNPERMLTTTVVIVGGTHKRLPVISADELPKDKIEACLSALYGCSVKAPVKSGQVIVENICGTGINIVASRSMKEKR
ncbi:MAG: DUF1667 domain-containing protein [Eubacterium sp.]